MHKKYCLAETGWESVAPYLYIRCSYETAFNEHIYATIHEVSRASLKPFQSNLCFKHIPGVTMRLLSVRLRRYLQRNAEMYIITKRALRMIRSEATRVHRLSLRWAKKYCLTLIKATRRATSGGLSCGRLIKQNTKDSAALPIVRATRQNETVAS